MKISELFESEKQPVLQLANRMLKFSVRNFDNILGVDLHSNKYDYYYCHYFIYVGKRGQYKVGDKVVFANADKPNISAYTAGKHDNHADEIRFVCSSIEEVMKVANKEAPRRDVRIIVDNEIVKNATPAPAKTSIEIEDAKDGYFVLGYWNNAYSRKEDKEYFWSGAFKDRKDATSWGNMKLKKGQPKTFRDWTGGSIKVIKGVDAFVKAAKAVDINPNVSNIELK